MDLYGIIAILVAAFWASILVRQLKRPRAAAPARPAILQLCVRQKMAGAFLSCWQMLSVPCQLLVGTTTLFRQHLTDVAHVVQRSVFSLVHALELLSISVSHETPSAAKDMERIGHVFCWLLLGKLDPIEPIVSLVTT